ncbi:MAG: Holliday junction resolvase RuvX [Alphaproteobacteria bacterium]|nr:Holliday junction resolvase RuvX [Alphaproteobacteria bacterium]TAD92029.1 MAG: Holliday junction resolvase RuvX [Alphaproteobacteria bacterium]
MPLLDLADLAATTRGRRLGGLDVGTKTIGIAIADALGVSATPVDTIRRTKFRDDAVRLAEVIRSREIVGLVIGLPISLDGTEGPRCQGVRQFQKNLDAVLPLPMAFWDERLSTAAVTRMMIDADMTRKRRAELVDKLAAAYILQGALDRLRDTRGV